VKWGDDMTDREKAIVMAYTGVCMLSGDKFQIFHKYVEDIMGRPVYTHEMAIKAVDDEIKEKAKADFIALCAEQEPCDDVPDINDGNIKELEVLDKIGAEIEEQVLESLSDGGDDWFAAEKVNECLEIIDKYKAESEE